MSWIQISITTTKTNTETAEDCLFAQGALTVTLSDAADQPILEPEPGQTPIWNDAIVTGLFPAEIETKLIQTALESCLLNKVNSDENAPAVTITHEILEDQNWTRAWMEHYQPMQFGERLWVCPWHLDPPDESAVNLRLDPGLAFGTGTHPTTALCLRWLGDNISNNINEHRTLLDFGCGSGILAIAARLLGLPQTDCVDIDPQALLATQDNASANHVSENTDVFLPDDYNKQHSDTQYDIVAANILSGPLAELAPQLAHHCKTGGNIILSGILQQQAETVRDVYSRYFDMDEAVIDEDWVLLHGIRQSNAAN